MIDQNRGTLLLVVMVAQIVISEPVNAYSLYTDRETWLAAVADLPLIEENFNSISDGEYEAGTIPSATFTNIEIFPANPLPMAISTGRVVPVFNRGFSVIMLFPEPVRAVGLDIINPDISNAFQYTLGEINPGGPVGGAFFYADDVSTVIDFIGWVAEDGDNSVLQTAVFFDPADRSQFGWDNLKIVTGGEAAVDTAVYGGVSFPAGASSFADKVINYSPTYSGGPVPDETQQDSRQILGVPGQGEMSLGRGGRITLKFLDNSLTGSDDSQKDLYVFEVGGAETTHIDISKDGRRWFSVGMATGFASGIDIDEYGFDSSDRFPYVRITDDGDTQGDFSLAVGADLVAVGARSSAPPVNKQPPINYYIQAHIGGRSELIMQGNKLQWHHIKGTAPGLERAFWSYGSNSNSPTIIDSNQGPSIPWVPSGWPGVIGNGTHPDSMSSVFDALTPVFPRDGKCWKLEKLAGSRHSGTIGLRDVRIVQQPNATNNYALVIEFNDMLAGDQGGFYNMAGSGFYSIKLSPTYTRC